MCRRTRCDWDQPVSLLQISLVEEKLDCNIIVLGVYNIPMLGTSVELTMGEFFLYFSDYRNEIHFFLLYDEVKQHYYCVTNIEGFLGVRLLGLSCLHLSGLLELWIC